MNSQTVHANEPFPNNRCNKSVWSVGFGVKDLPIVMQAMFIIQLQIVPDKVLLSDRDTFLGRQKLGEKTNDVILNI